MRASEQSRRRQLMQPRVERAHRGCCALNVGELPPRGRQSRSTTREHKLLVHVPAALCERWAQGVRRKSGHRPQGNQPENWWAERRSFVSGNPVVFFNAAGALEQVTQERYMVSACLVFPQACLTSTVPCPRSFLLSPYFSPPSPFLLSSLFVLQLAHCRPSLRAYLSLRHIWPISWTLPWAGFQRRLPRPWPRCVDARRR